MSSRRLVPFLAAVFLLAILLGSFRLPRDEAAEPNPPPNHQSQTDKGYATACAEAEKYLRAGKAKEARDTLAPLFKDRQFEKSDYRNVALCYHGLACFQLKDYSDAGRSLSRLAPFDQPEFGPHAHYLLARVHHMEDERAEAVTHYEAVLADYDARKAEAVEALKQPDTFIDKPAEKARLEALVASAPDFVGRAGFYLGVLHYEAGRFADSRARFSEFVERQPDSPLALDAQLFQGMSEVGLQQYTDALQTLQPLAEKETTRTGWALWWLGKAHAGSAESDDPEADQAALKKAIEMLRLAADTCKPSPNDPADRKKDMNSIRGEILLDLGEVYVKAGQPKEAAGVFAQIHDERLSPKRDEESRQRQASALNLAGALRESDEVCSGFLKSYPRSLLLPEVHFRRAENAFFQATTAKKDAKELNEAAAKAYRQVAELFPEFANANLARYGLALVHYRRAEYDKALAELDRIPAVDFNGELAYAPLLLADCLIRLTPTHADDALAAGRIDEQLLRAVTLLTEFAAGQGDDPQVPDALLRLGLCQQRLAAQLSQDEERKKMLNAARATYERILVDYPLNNVRSRAALERARCIAQAGDPNEALNRLRAFSIAPLDKETVAPLAVLQRATLLRGQENQAVNAAKLLGQCRKRYEKELLADPARAAWAPLLQFHHAVALQESSQVAEARPLFEALIQQYPDRPEALEAVIFRGVCLRDEGGQKIDQANQTLGAPDVSPAVAEAAKKSIAEGEKMIRDAFDYFEQQADLVAKKEPVPPIRARLLYQAAWGRRIFGDREVEAVRNNLREELRVRLQEEAAKNTVEGQPVPVIASPDVPLEKIPLQPSEIKTRALYQAIINGFADLPLANYSRLELAEIHAGRGDLTAAVKLLKEALDSEPPADMTERIRLRLGVCLAAQGDVKAAVTQFEAVSRNADSGYAAHARYLAGESLLRRGEFDAAAKHFAPFRDEEKFQSIGGITDAALVRLGHSLARMKKWDESRTANQQLIERFPESPWALQARYTIGWTQIQEKKTDEPLETLAPILAAPKSEATARGMVMTGVCHLLRMKPDEALEVLRGVTADFPDLHALALLESAYASSQLEQSDEATKLLRQVVHDYPKTSWAEAAQKRLDAPADATPPHELTAAVALLTPDAKDAWTLDQLGPMQPDSVSLDDPTVEASHAFTLARTPPQRDKPAPWLKLTVPEPFEFRLPIRVEDLPKEQLPAK
jgi:TolA-binding protein